MPCNKSADCPLHDRICDLCLNNEPPADGPVPEMYSGYAERCANCKWYQMARQRCLKDDTQTSRNLYCEDWEDINGG